MKRPLFFALSFLVTHSLFAFEQTFDRSLDEIDFKAAFEQEYLTPPPPEMKVVEEGVFMPQFPKVNVVTGEYCEEECDLLVAGIEPLSYRRFYGTSGHKDQAFGHWRINPECSMSFNFEYTKKGKEKYKKFTGIGERNGSVFIYDKISSNTHHFDAQATKSFTHEHLSGQNHPLNTHISFHHRESGKKDFYEGLIEDGSGGKRFFKSDKHKWPKNKKFTDISTPPPYQAMITEEKRPNGNVIRYEYTNYNEPMEHDDSIPKYYILKSITAYNSTGTTVLGSLNIDYCRTKRHLGSLISQIHVTGSDGRKAGLFQYNREIERPKGSTPAQHDVVLDHVKAPGKPIQTYSYRWEKSKKYFEAPFLYQVASPTGGFFTTSYDLNTKKVTAQNAPVGPNGEMVPIVRYEYFNDYTVVYDAENNKTIYRFDADNRIHSIEKYQGAQLYSVEHTIWDSATGNLLKKTLEDDLCHLLRFYEYTYDENQNVIEEKTGDSQGCDTIFRTFSKDGFNLKLTESDRPNKRICYHYIPGTNLLDSELVYDGNRICKRTFHFYDDEVNSIRIKTIIDDGSTDNPLDLTGVTFRQIIEIYPKFSFPCLGLPQEIQEKVLKPDGKETLLKKIRFTYHPSGKIAKEEHYDAHDVLRYILTNHYDDLERLISSTNAMGHKISFAYDANFNLIAQSGPRSDMHKERTYDLANRPIQEKVWQSDGTILTRDFQFDKASHLRKLKDENGFETHYEYDAAGNIIAIYYPNGNPEHKEYDALGNVLKEIDAKGYITRKEYNFRNQPTAIYHPDGSEEHFQYNNNSGTLASYTDRNGAKTVHTYDIFDRLLNTQTYSSSGILLKSTSSHYSTFDKLADIDAEGVLTTYTYDFAGRKIAEEKAGKKICFYYDSLGRLYKTQEADVCTIETYDLLNQPIEKRIEDLSGNLLFQEKYVYDAACNLTHTITSKGVFETSYDSQGRVLSKKDPLGHMTHFSYAFQGGLTTTETGPTGIRVTIKHDYRGNVILKFLENAKGTLQKNQRAYDPNGNLICEEHTVFDETQPLKVISHHWVYGPLNRIEKCLEAGEKETHYIYDTCGRLSSKIKPDKTSLHHEYDALGRLSRLSASDIDYRYSYDKKDRILSVFDALSHTKTLRSYDALGNLIREELANTLILTNTYDTQGRRIQIELPDRTCINYSYQSNRLHQVSRKGTTYTYLERDLEGLPIHCQLPCRLGSVRLERDSLSRWKAFSSPFFSAHFNSYDPLGNLLHYHTINSTGTEEYSYSYDSLNQLISEKEHSYHFDSLHNRLKKDHRTHQINNLCQVTHDGITEYSYDRNGNLLSDRTSHYVYDTLDRLIKVQKDGIELLFTYDPFNRRLSKKVFKNKKTISSQFFLWDGENEIGATNDAGALQELRILGEGLGAEIGAAVLLELKGKDYLPIHDHRGCLVALIDLKTQKVENYKYTAFGEELSNPSLCPWRFASKRMDAETGLIYFGRRYYSPQLGRWITTDPQGFEDGPNCYAYVHNNPLTHFDLYGLFDAYENQIRAFARNPLQIPSQPILFPPGGCRSYGGSFESGFSNKSYSYQLRNVLDVSSKGFAHLPELPNGGKISFINGMDNEFTEALIHMINLSKNAGGYNIYGVYNANHSKFFDLVEGHGNLGYQMTEPAYLLQDLWSSMLADCPIGKTILHFCTSQGAIHTRNALLNYPHELRNRIDVVAIAPGAYIPPEICHTIMHYAARWYRDLVPQIDFVGKWKYRDTITYLNSHPDASLHDHSFSSPTYQQSINDRIDIYSGNN